MRLLPELVTPAGTFWLPLSDTSASGLIAAMVCDEPTARRERLADAIAHDAPLALWTLCRAATRGYHEIRTVRQLSEWLAGTAMAEFNVDSPGGASNTPPTSAGAVDAWAELAGLSQAVAELAAERARHARLDPERTYFLGLVHAAQRWLAMSAVTAAPLCAFADERAAILPAWLRGELGVVATGHSARATSPAECVAWAVRATKGNAPPQSNAEEFAFDAEAHRARIVEAADRWRRPCAAAERLPELLRKLARLERLECDFEQTLQAEKLESLKELAYGAGHEINNPLANISARAQTLLQDEHDPDRRRTLSAINTQAFRAYEMIADMMLFARPPQPKLEAIDLVAVVRAVHDELAPQAADQQSEWVVRAPEAGLANSALVVQADKTQIAVALRALCVNALEALGSGGRVEISIAEPAPLAKNVQITVSDNGPGIAADARPHIFDPFYSGREAGRGLGFGLSKCWRIVTLHGGSVEVESSVGAGARFTIVLPRDHAR